MKNKMKKIQQSIMFAAMLFMMNVQQVFATGTTPAPSGAVTFNAAQAKTDLTALLNPISNVLIFIALPITIVSIGISYLSWNTKDEEEKESMPFTKIVKKYIIAFIIFGLSGAILKWFTISS